MDSDLVALKQRIGRVERLVGTSACVNKNMLKELRAAHKHMQKVVPDEMAAAYKAVALLSSVATLPPSRAGCAHKLKRVQGALQRAEAHVEPFVALQGVLEGGVDVGALDRDALGLVERGVGDVSCRLMEEEQKVDALLVEFNDVTERLNSAILSMAQALQGGGNKTEEAK